MNTSTALGCVPALGTVMGIGRVAIALNKAHEHRTSNLSSSIFDALSKTGGYKEIYHGACEIIPLIGPLQYGLTNLIALIAKKIVNYWNSTKNNADSSNSLSNAQEKVVDIKGVKSCDDLKIHIGKKIQLDAPRYAHKKIDSDRNWHGLIQNISCVGTLIKISDKTFGNHDRYAITLSTSSPFEDETTFYMSDRELTICNI